MIQIWGHCAHGRVITTPHTTGCLQCRLLVELMRQKPWFYRKRKP